MARCTGFYRREFRPRGAMLCMFAALVAASPSGARAENPAIACGGTLNIAEAVEAADGATLRLADGRELRLASLIAPGVLDENVAAQAHAAETLRRLAAGKRVSFFADKDTRDRYGRVAARATIIEPQTWLEAALTEAGAARVAVFGNDDCVTALLARERKARAANAGLWAEPAFAPFAATDLAGLNGAVGRFAVVEGRIARVGETRSRLYLDFGRRYIEDFTIVVPENLRKALQTKGSDPKSWRGRRVRVRGMLVSWGGPAIELSAAAAVELLDQNEP